MSPACSCSRSRSARRSTPCQTQLLVAHMAEHLLIGDIAALLLVLGMTGPLIAPLLRNPVIARLRVLAHPVVAIVLWAVNFYVWHAPYLYQAALRHDALHALEHATFLVFGMAVYMALLGPAAQAGLVQQRGAAGVHRRGPPHGHGAGQRPRLRRHRLLPHLPLRGRPVAHQLHGRPGGRGRIDDGGGELSHHRPLLLAVPARGTGERAAPGPDGLRARARSRARRAPRRTGGGGGRSEELWERLRARAAAGGAPTSPPSTGS